MLTFNVVVLTGGKTYPVTDSLLVSSVTPSCLPEVSVVGRSPVICHQGRVSDLVRSVSQLQAAVVVAGKVESVVGGCWSNKPSLEVTSMSISNVVWRLKGHSKLLREIVGVHVVPVQPTRSVDELLDDSVGSDVGNARGRHSVLWRHEAGEGSRILADD